MKRFRAGRQTYLRRVIVAGRSKIKGHFSTPTKARRLAFIDGDVFDRLDCVAYENPIWRLGGHGQQGVFVSCLRSLQFLLLLPRSESRPVRSFDINERTGVRSQHTIRGIGRMTSRSIRIVFDLPLSIGRRPSADIGSVFGDQRSIPMTEPICQRLTVASADDDNTVGRVAEQHFQRIEQFLVGACVFGLFGKTDEGSVIVQKDYP